MATAYAVKIAPDNTGLWQIQQTEPAARKATELLQRDLETHHVFFNNSGFHNHISHQVLALFGTGASADALSRGYAENEGYQRPKKQTHDQVIEELKDWGKAKTRLGKGQHYADWLVFFQHEIERLGWQGALQEYLFKGDERSEDLLVRMHGGFVHPLIQLMYGVEWQQPAIVAMALAQGAVHSDNLSKFLATAEKKSKEVETPMPSIVSLLDEVARDEKMRKSAHLDDDNKMRDGVLTRAWDEAIRYAAQVKVRPDEIDEKTAEMYHAAIYEAACAAIRPGKEPKFEFFLMHHVNVCPIFITLNKQDWIPAEVKGRLLEWKIRLDLIQYAARGCPELNLDKIASYVPKDKNLLSGLKLLPRMHKFIDDGHAIKLFRAIGVGQHVCEPYEDRDWIKIKGELWAKVLNMVADSVEAGGPTWVRNAGFDEAWTGVPDRLQQNGDNRGNL